jgi:hypothetical protein
MTDPAVEAAQRAWATWIETWATADQPYFSLAVAAACEALRPIRELHRRDEFGHCAEACIDMHGNAQPWPCDTAKLVYSESEL